MYFHNSRGIAVYEKQFSNFFFKNKQFLVSECNVLKLKPLRDFRPSCDGWSLTTTYISRGFYAQEARPYTAGFAL